MLPPLDGPTPVVGDWSAAAADGTG